MKQFELEEVINRIDLYYEKEFNKYPQFKIKPFRNLNFFLAKRRKYNPMRLLFGEYFITHDFSRALEDWDLDAKDTKIIDKQK